MSRSEQHDSVEITLYAHAFSKMSVGVSENPMKAGVRENLTWIPRSQITPVEGEIDSWRKGDLIKFMIPEWLANKEGLI